MQPVQQVTISVDQLIPAAPGTCQIAIGRKVYPRAGTCGATGVGICNGDATGIPGDAFATGTGTGGGGTVTRGDGGNITATGGGGTAGGASSRGLWAT